jgi:hypothetical protein
MRPWLLLALLAAATPARGDSSVASAPDPKTRCHFDDGPHWRARRSLDGFRLGDFDHGHLAHATPHHLLLSHIRGEGHPARTLILDRATRAAVLRFDGGSHALVEDAAGTVIGTLRHESDDQRGMLTFRDAKSGATRWTVAPRAGRALGEAASTVLAGDLLILAHFHRHSTGAGLFAFDVRTGATRWIGDPEQVGASHSEYFNDVAIERRGDTIVMRGWEASGCYVQTFDLATGKRLSSHMKRAW